MKYLTIILAFLPITGAGQTILDLAATAEYSSPSFLKDNVGVKEVYQVDQKADTLIVYRKWYQWQAGYGPGITCAVMGCNSDHKYHYRDRLLFVDLGDEMQFIRREVGKLEDKEVKTTVKEWIYKY